MLGISGIGSAGAASAYFAKDNYYSRGEAENASKWTGKLAETLGLQGAVKASDLQNILEGRVNKDTRVGAEIKGEWKHNPGRDFTFSMPKSASILALVGKDDRIVQAYKDAVKEGMAHVERHLIVTRIKDETGQRRDVKTGNMVGAIYVHDTSRRLDPNGHIHFLVANMTQREDGKYTSVNMFPIYKERYALNQIVHERFRNSMHQLGYKTYDLDKGGHFDIEGVPRELIDKYSTGRNQINEELKDIENPQWGQRQIANLNTRGDKIVLSRDDLNAKWDAQAEEMGFDPKAFVAQTQRQPRESNPSLFQRVIEDLKTRYADFKNPPTGETIRSLDDVTAYTVRALADKDTTFTRTTLIAETSSIMRGAQTTENIEASIERLEKTGELLIYEPDKSAGNLYTTQGAVESERYILNQIETGKHAEPITAGADRIDQLLSQHSLTDGQAASIKHILTHTDRIRGVQGYAGVGKTYMLGMMKSVSDQVAREGNIQAPKFLGLAPTTQAADALKETGLDTVMTSQMFQSRYGNYGNGYSAPKDLIEQWKGTHIILDESSMKSNGQMERLVRTANELKMGHFIPMGDTEQIQSLKAGTPFRMMQKYEMATAHMDEILRQTNPVIKQAVIETTKKDFGKAMQTLTDYTSNHRDPVTAAARYFMDMKRQGTNAIVITPENRHVTAVNKQIRSMMIDEGFIDKQQSTFPTFQSVHLSDIEKQEAKNYPKGAHLFFHKTVANQRFQAGSAYKIMGHDLKTDTLTLLGLKGMTDWKVDRNMKKFPYDVVEKSQLDIAKGDHIKFKIPDKDLELKRNETATVSKLSSRMIEITTEGGRKISVPNDSPAAKGITHNYAGTAYANQGATHDNVLLVMMGNAVSTTRENFYVGISRAKEFLHIFTDDADRLSDKLGRDTGEERIAKEYDGSRPSDIVHPSKSSEPHRPQEPNISERTEPEIPEQQMPRSDRSR